ncbi:Coq4 family protein [Parvularcula sp. IMCC14364]|uniref:Coq4 family protein n=1 Tax=Parvularcula sp. IMCC14364 TaxID=3067902 RepID=UPI00274206FA|nr:Coq4 family protein [Parvularcula sp. IMCC14364]
MGYRPLSFSRKYRVEELETIEGFPVPPTQPVAPFHAFASVMKLLANKEDTRQVFEIVGAMAGKSHHRFFERFVSSDYGRRVATEPVKLEEIMTRKEWLRSLPDGSVGRAYLAFMEGENLTPDGVVGAAEEAGIGYTEQTQFPEMRRMSLNFEVAHVITGYGRDTLGELCLLIYTRTQTGNEGLRLITWIGALAGKVEKPGMKILSAMKEAKAMGDKSAWLPAEDIEALLEEPLSAARARMNIIDPVVYKSIPVDEKSALLKPRVQATQSQREQAA